MDRRRLKEATKDKFGGRYVIRIVRGQNGFVISSRLANGREDIYVFETIGSLMNSIDVLIEQIEEPYNAAVISGKYDELEKNHE